MQVSLAYIKDIDWNIQKQKRSGAIVYTLYKNQIYFLAGVDTSSGNITDFGGGIKLKAETPLTGGLREFSEESCGIFGSIDEKDVSDHLVIYTNDLMIIFIHITFNIDRIMMEFNTRIAEVSNPEVNSLILMNSEQFVKLIKGGAVNERIMYDKIRTVLKDALINKGFLEYL